MARKKDNLEFRYYDIPHGEPLLALYGDDWIRPYGYDKNLKPIVDLHFHNLMEVGWCCYGAGEIVLEGEERTVSRRDADSHSKKLSAYDECGAGKIEQMAVSFSGHG